jgi:hypothetical protein
MQPTMQPTMQAATVELAVQERFNASTVSPERLILLRMDHIYFVHEGCHGGAKRDQILCWAEEILHEWCPGLLCVRACVRTFAVLDALEKPGMLRPDRCCQQLCAWVPPFLCPRCPLECPSLISSFKLWYRARAVAGTIPITHEHHFMMHIKRAQSLYGK